MKKEKGKGKREREERGDRLGGGLDDIEEPPFGVGKKGGKEEKGKGGGNRESSARALG